MPSSRSLCLSLSFCLCISLILFASSSPHPYFNALKETHQTLKNLLGILLDNLTPSSKISKFNLLFLKFHNLSFKTVRHDELLDDHISLLSQTVHAVYSLHLHAGVELRFHHEDVVGGCEVQALTAGFDGNETDCDGRVGFEAVEDGGAGADGEFAVQAEETDVVVAKGDFDQVEVGCLRDSSMCCLRSTIRALTLVWGPPYSTPFLLLTWPFFF
jgi:hypothetical protein